ncbi:hypothetical protein DSD29_11365, partial [Weissella confusa]|nr:hypothetical protein [Weissella confusa]
MAKEHPFDFKKWDAFLAEIEGKEIPWVMGAVADGHPQYDERMIELAKAFEWSEALMSRLWTGFFGTGRY